MNKWRSKKSAFVKRILTATLALGLVAGTLLVAPIISDAASRKVDLKAPCSVLVKASPAQEQEINDDFKVADVVIDFYQVATAEEYLLSDGYKFKLTDKFDGKLTLPDEMDRDKWDKLAQEATKLIKDSLDKGSNEFTPINDTEPLKIGNKLEKMDAGLYLVIARGSKDADYIQTIEKTSLVNGSIVTEDVYVTVAKGEYYEFSFAPEFISVPTKEPDKNGVISTANEGEWIYDADIFLKYTAEPRKGTLKIEKKLTVYEKSDPAYFLFEVVATKNGKEYYDDLKPMRFSKAGLETVTIDGLWAGSEVTITEIYSGCSYKLVSPKDQTATIKAEDIVKVEFVNTYENHEKHCGAITNHFAPIKNQDGTYKTDEKGNYVYSWEAWEDKGEED